MGNSLTRARPLWYAYTRNWLCYWHL